MQIKLALFARPARPVPSPPAAKGGVLAGVLSASLAILAATFVISALQAAAPLYSAVAPPPPVASHSFRIDAELASLLFANPVRLSELPVEAPDPSGTFAPAKGPPLELLAQVDTRSATAAVSRGAPPL